MAEKLICIENNTSEIYLISLTKFSTLQLLPGININIPVKIIKHLLKCYPHYQALFDTGLLVVKDFNKSKVYEDKDTGLTYVDDGGEKVPIVKAKKSGHNIPLSTGKYYTMQELRNKGVSATLSRKILTLTPENGWHSKAQMINNLGLKESQVGKLEVLDLPNK